MVSAELDQDNQSGKAARGAVGFETHKFRLESCEWCEAPGEFQTQVSR